MNRFRTLAALTLGAAAILAFRPAGAGGIPPGAFGLLADSLEILSSGGMGETQVAVLACSIDRGDTLLALNPERRMIPGSNVKLFTTGSFLRLAATPSGLTGPGATTIAALGGVKISGDGRDIRLKGDLILRGCGLPDVYQLLHPGSRGLLDSLAFLLHAGGLRAFQGTLWVDGTLFAPEPYGPGWAYDDLVYSFAAPVGAILANGNAATLEATATSRGVELSLHPPETPLTIAGSATVIDSATPGRLSVRRALGSRVLEVAGAVPRGGTVRRQVAVPEPDSAAGLVLLGAMRRAGIEVKGSVRMIVPSDAHGAPEDSGWTRVTKHRAATVISLPAPSAAEIAGVVNALSLNVEAEALLRDLDPAFPKRREGGLIQVRRLAAEAGIDTMDLSLVDGSGLSPMNLVTARAVVTWLTAMERDSTLGPLYREGLARPGNPGTLKGRFAGAGGASTVRAKSGTLTNVSALSGFVSAEDGERIVFSILSNGNRGSGEAARAVEERLVQMLSRLHRAGPPSPEPVGIPR